MSAFFTSIYRQVTALDLDEIFSYQTTKEVRMLDRRLGMVNWLIKALVLVYVIGYVFIWREGYTEIEKSVGHVISQVNGTTYSQYNGQVQPWDAIDVVQPALENGAAFIATTVYLTPGQTVGDGANPMRRCTADSECTQAGTNPLNYGRCTNNFCQERTWIPAYSPDDRVATSVYELQTADRLGVWLKSSIQFPTLDATRVFSTIGAVSRTRYVAGAVTEVSDSAASTTLGDGVALPPDYFTIAELLSLAQTCARTPHPPLLSSPLSSLLSPPTAVPHLTPTACRAPRSPRLAPPRRRVWPHSSYDTVRQTGCTLSVSFMWSCFVDASSTCAPTIQVTRLDVNERRRGFEYQYAHYYRPTAGGPSTRDLHTVKGVRILLSSRGEGKKISISAIMLQISSMIALLWLANFAADFLMLHVLPERKHYRTYKQERTPDFSDLRNKIAEVEGEKKKLRDRKNRFAAKLDES